MAEDEAPGADPEGGDEPDEPDEQAGGSVRGGTRETGPMEDPLEEPETEGRVGPGGLVDVAPPDRRVEASAAALRQLQAAPREPGGEDVPADVRRYDRFKKVDGAQYERVNEFLRERTYITAREWAIARLCADFRTETGIEMTKIGENLPHLVPFMTDTYTPQAVNQARASFETKVRKAGATFLYGAMSDFFSADELDDVMYEVTEVAKFLLEVEGVDLSVDEELEGEERISSVMREVRRASDQLRHEGTTCPNCGHEIGGEE
ncbi:MAG: DUF5806 family protein [Halodesulfurarchaeum sp.]